MTQRIDWSISSEAVIRVLVISYFIALSLGLIPGTSLSTFLLPVLPEQVAVFGIHACVLFLSCLILMNFYRRASALVLSLIVFYSSYVALFSGGDIGAFWRDLALIGALLMTAKLARMKDTDASWDDLPSDPEFEEAKSEAPGEASILDHTMFREDFDVARTG